MTSKPPTTRQTKADNSISGVAAYGDTTTQNRLRQCQRIRWRESGQAMPLGIALVMFGILAGLLLFNTGQLVTTKTRVTNTADAAAYSGLVWQTRALNFQSYSNRAMVANQVTIAQAVSLRSWSLYGKIAAENMRAVLSAVPVLNVASGAFETVMSTTEALLEPITEVLAEFVDELNGILGRAQETMYQATFAATPEIVSSVIKANDPTFSGDTRYSVIQRGRNLTQWQSFTEQYDADDHDAMHVRSDLINRSTDRFSSRRDWEFFSHWFYVTPLVRFKMHKQGETRLVAVNDEGEGGALRWEWKAKDNLSLNARIWRPFRSTKRIELPIGWGQAYANADSERSIEAGCSEVRDESTDRVTEECERWFRWNRSAEYMSDNNIRSPVSGADSRVRMSGSYHGIRAFRDLSNLGDQEKDPRLVLRVEVEANLAEVATSGKAGINGLFELPTSGASAGSGEALAAIASAEVYFQRPLLEDNQPLIEYASGYSPFWDVRLVDTPVSDHALALQLRGVKPLSGDVAPSAVLPGARLPGQSEQVPLSASTPALDAYSANATNTTVNLPSQLTADTETLQPTYSPAYDQSFDDLSDQLASAAKDLLSGAVAGVNRTGISSTGISAPQVESSAARVVDRLTALDVPIKKAEAEARTIYERVRDEFEAIKKDVALSYQAEKDRFDLQQIQLKIERDSTIQSLEAQLLEETDPDVQQQLNIALEEARAVQAMTPEEREASLANLLVNIINERTSAYPIDFDTALSIVTLETDIGTSLSDQLRLSCGEVPGDYDVADCE